jgi:transposase
MRYELTDYEWTAIKPMLPNKPRGVSRMDGRCIHGAWAKIPPKRNRTIAPQVAFAD